MTSGHFFGKNFHLVFSVLLVYFFQPFCRAYSAHRKGSGVISRALLRVYFLLYFFSMSMEFNLRCQLDASSTCSVTVLLPYFRNSFCSIIGKFPTSCQFVRQPFSVHMNYHFRFRCSRINSFFFDALTCPNE